MTTIDYTQIDNNYDNFLQRPGQIAANSNPVSMGNVETMPVKSDGSQADIWIKNFIRSENWQPKSVGFSIDGQTGYAEFVNVFVNGEIQALSGLIGGFTIGATDLSVTSGGDTTIISSGNIAFQSGPTGSPTVQIYQNGLLQASNVQISGTITGSTITGSTITGGIIQTAAHGQSVRMNGITNRLEFEDSTNAIVGYIAANVGAMAFTAAGGQVIFFDNDNFYPLGGVDLGGSSITPWRNMNLTGYISTDGDISSNGNVSGNTGFFTSSIGTLATSMDFNGATLDMSGGSKAAIVPTSKGFNALYCTESPEIWFMDFCEDKDKLDPLFMEVTVAPYHFIKCGGGEYQVWGKRKGHEEHRFDSKTAVDFWANEKFLKMSKPTIDK